MRNALFSGTIAAATALAAGILPSTSASAGEPMKWWTGISHGTAFGQFAPPAPGRAEPTCKNINDPPPGLDPNKWWAANAVIVASSDAVGTTVFEDAACSRAMQTVYRSEMSIDLSPFYTTLSATPVSGTPQGARITKALLHFNVVPITPSSIPSGFLCSQYIGGVGVVSTLNRSVVFTRSPTGLTQVGPISNVAAAFPAADETIVDLSFASGPGTIGAATITDIGAPISGGPPGIHAVDLDVTKWLRGAVNLNFQSIGFTVAGVGETPIVPPTFVNFDCRSWVQPTGIDVFYF